MSRELWCEEHQSYKPSCPWCYISELEEEVDRLSKYRGNSTIQFIKFKKGVPTVIVFNGRRYVLDHKTKVEVKKNDRGDS